MPAFDAFVRQQAHQDFDAAEGNPPPNASWFQRLLPYSPP